MRVLEVLKRRPLAILWLSQLLSAIGDQLHVIALSWMAVELAGPAGGWVLAASALSSLAFSFIGGVLADRWDRRRTMVAVDLFRAALVCTLPVMWSLGFLPLWYLALVAVGLGALDALFIPALHASLPAIAQGPALLASTNALMDATTRMARIFGPGAAGVLLSQIPLPHFFTLDAVTFVASAAALLALGRGFRWKAAEPSAPSQWKRELFDALTLIRSHPGFAWAVALTAAMNVPWALALRLGVPLFAKDALRGDVDAFGYLMAAYGVGSLPSTLWMSQVSVRRPLVVLYAGALVAAVGFLGFAFAPGLWQAMACLAVAGAGGPMIDLMLLSMVQSGFPNSQLGKVYSLRRTLTLSGWFLGTAVAGPLIALAGLRPAVLGSALFLGLIGAVGLYKFARTAGSPAV